MNILLNTTDITKAFTQIRIILEFILNQSKLNVIARHKHSYEMNTKK